ncbi:hypothetical protein BJ508DRAFT_361802 [Ascobolus immersus RN42]|uniref:protein-ribulosamine 3-kinase n=1 Tax=Ascobolus immersus RN42 TaxID=1160509 RepID=A0A3N4IBU4_ASCIM|nr:hypothetical protein BJ508DRAFT_361802 [Ascobolus immersus RN42]
MSEKYSRADMVANGEYESMTRIYRLQPSFCPEPFAYGWVNDETPKSLLPDNVNPKVVEGGGYYISEYADFVFRLGDADETGGIPDGDTKRKTAIMEKFCKMLVTLHTGRGTDNIQVTKFGLDTYTYVGLMVQQNEPSTSWRVLFQKDLLTLKFHILQIGTHGGSMNEGLKNELHQAYEEMVKLKVIEMLLDDLREPDGGPLKPRLLHGDLRCGNTALARGDSGDKSPRPVVFNACSFYGHNEYELGNWVLERNNLKNYIPMYLKAYGGKCRPTEKFDLRLQLYSIRFNLQSAVLFPTQDKYLRMAINDMNDLLDKVGRKH